MSGVAVGIEGLKKLNTLLEELKKALPQDVEYALGRGLLILEDEAKILCPVDVGRLRESITTETQQQADSTVTGAVGTNVEYAAYVEYGTGIYAENEKGRQTPWLAKVDPKKLTPELLEKFKPSKKDGMIYFWTQGMHPRPFLRPAVDNKADDAVEEIRGSLRDRQFGRL